MLEAVTSAADGGYKLHATTIVRAIAVLVTECPQSHLVLVAAIRKKEKCMAMT